MSSAMVADLTWVDELSARVRAALGPRVIRASAIPPRPVAIPLEARHLGPFLDHTLLRADATGDEIRKLALEARQLRCAGACVNPRHVARVARELEGSQTAPVAVVGFPLGATLPRVKVFEARAAMEEGARELDVVMDLAALRENELRRALDELAEVVGAVAPLPVKVIIETALLRDEQKVKAAVVAELAGAAFVKTSTGFQGGGATEQDVQLLGRVTGNRIRIKASGGIRTAGQALALLRAGADRLGTSAAPELVSAVSAAEGPSY